MEDNIYIHTIFGTLNSVKNIVRFIFKYLEAVFLIATVAVAWANDNRWKYLIKGIERLRTAAYRLKFNVKFLLFMKYASDANISLDFIWVAQHVRCDIELTLWHLFRYWSLHARQKTLKIIDFIGFVVCRKYLLVSRSNLVRPMLTHRYDETFFLSSFQT